MVNKEVLIYDFDGVICDSVKIKTNAFIELYKNYSLKIQNQVKEYHILNSGISRFEKNLGIIKLFYSTKIQMKKK